MKCSRSVRSQTFAAVALAFTVCGIPSALAGWQLAWSDEFDGAAVDTNNWVFEIGNGNNGWGNSEREYYTSRTNNAYVSGGVLHIVARQESYGGFPYTSARMKTQGKFSQTYGRFEFRAKLPRGLGFWPALWMMGEDITTVGWPACGEIDVMEFNGSWQNQVQGTIHYSDASNNHLQQTKVYTLPTPGDSATNFHTYAIEWTTNSIKWLVDSNAVQTWTSWSSSTGPYPAPFNTPFFLLMNVAVGGSYLGNPSDAQINAGTVFPGEMQVDYVRVYANVVSRPDTPTGLIAGVGNAKVSLTWDTSAGATAYNVKRATTSGGPYTTIARPTSSSYTDTAVSSCSSYYYVVSATNSLGESADSSEASASLGAFSLAVNSGGAAAGQFIADTYFSGGTQAGAVSTTIDTSGVINPAPQAVYQTERFGNFTYTFTGLTAGQNYKVRLHFAETYWTTNAQRVFNVSINGTQVLSNFDIIATAGAANKATIQEFSATANGGQIVIQYTTVKDNAKSSGIEILIPRTATPTGLAATAGDALVSLNWNPVAGAASYNVKRSLLLGGPYTLLAGGLTGVNYTDPGLTNGTTYYYVVSAVGTGCESADAAPVSATPACSAPPSPVAGNNGPIWAGMTLNLTATTVPGATYSWTGPNGFVSTRQNPAITNATTSASGLYSVTAITGSCASAPATTLVTVIQPPSLTIQLSAGNAILSWPAGSLMSATNVDGIWSDVGGATSPYTNPAAAPRQFYRLRP